MSRVAKTLITLLLVVGVDQYSKIMAKKMLLGKGVSSHFNDMWRWVFAENTGAFLSWGSDLSGWVHVLFLKVIPVILIIGLLFYTMFSKEVTKNQVLPLALILGGGIGNLYDRLLYGKVIDFMNIGIGDLRTGIFNVADMAIMAGIFWLLFVGLKKKPDDKKKEEVTTLREL